MSGYAYILNSSWDLRNLSQSRYRTRASEKCIKLQYKTLKQILQNKIKVSRDGGSPGQRTNRPMWSRNWHDCAIEPKKKKNTINTAENRWNTQGEWKTTRYLRVNESNLQNQRKMKYVTAGKILIHETQNILWREEGSATNDFSNNLSRICCFPNGVYVCYWTTVLLTMPDSFYEPIQFITYMDPNYKRMKTVKSCPRA
jgi:hypothetical protein